MATSDSTFSDSAAEVTSPHALLESAAHEGRRVVVGGRVVLGSQPWCIADAFASVPVALASARIPSAGALVVVRGDFEQGRLSNAELVDEQSGSTPEIPEFERLFQGGVGTRLRLRARVLDETRRFFLNAGFLEVDTPLRSAESGTETHVEPLRSGPSYLITSPELHMKRLLVAGVPKLFQIVHCFRAGELGPWHAPEFSMLEWYRAFADWTSMLTDTERLIAGLAESVHGGPEIQLAGGRRIDLRPPFLRLSVREAFARHADVADAAALAAADEAAFFQILVDRVEPALASYAQPVFLHDYPSSQAALARVCPSDPSVAERFELYVAGIELCNGYGELSDPREQRRRCEIDRERRRALGRPVPEPPANFLTALERGMPKASGNALGMDRLIALLAGQSAIEEVCPFPPALV